MPTVTKYAQIFNPQVNPNATQRMAWKNLAHATGGTENNYAISNATTKNYPWTTTAHSFDLNIPDGAYIKQVKFQVRMKASVSGTTQIPVAGFFLRGQSSSISTVKKGQTGYNQGVFWHYGNRSKLTTTPTVYNYTMEASDFYKIKNSVSGLNSEGCGVDLHWNKASKDTIIYLDWVRLSVTYELPKYSLQYDLVTSSNNPREVKSNKYFQLKATFTNNSQASGVQQVIDVNIPFGTEYVQHGTTVGTYNPTTSKWTIPAKAKQKATLTLGLVTRTSKLNELTTGNNTIGNYSYWFNSTTDFPTEYGDLEIALVNEAHKNHVTCFDVKTKLITDYSSIMYVFNPCTSSSDYEFVSFEFNSDESSDGVTVHTDASAHYPKFNVPVDEEVEIAFRVCARIKSTGDKLANVYRNEYTTGASLNYTCYDPYDYVVELENRADDLWITRRIASQLDTNQFIFPCGVKQGDAVMIQSDCNLRMYKWEKLDYIGCVPLEHTHFDPKSTFKDTLLNETYKNKKYMGKKGVIDEDITLNVRVRPADVTTLQGLISMDKPIPINTCHNAFEGDALTHRGWCEIYSIQAEKTNPLYYKCEIDVKYLTHNINTRFEIEKAKKSNNYKVPSILSNTYSSGEPFSDIFDVTTDGTYLYDENALEYERNLFSLDNNQSLFMKTKEPLENVSNFILRWSSSKISENKENQITRIISLVDAATNEPVFKYEYYDFDFSDDDFYVGHVTAMVRDNDDWEEIINEDIILDVDGSAYSFAYSDTNDYESNVYSESDNFFGSILHLEINNRKLSIIDEGFNGKEISIDDIGLEGETYYATVEIQNKNTDGDDSDIITYLDVDILNTVLTSSIDADKYSKMYISPFPVADKRLLFTRSSEEGTIYYYDDDGKRFTYLIEPFYQYHCGTDMVTRDGISIFTLSNSYSIVYIQNGLVRLGLNRLNGDMYLAKYDVEAREYVTVANLHIDDNTTFTLGAFSDDKIEILASKSKFTIYRGHPFIVINHSDEDIHFKSKVINVWAEGINGNMLEYPALWELRNNQNLLDACVGGVATLDENCVEVEEVEVTVTPHDIILSVDEEVTINQSVPFNVSGVQSGDVHYIVDGIDSGTSTLPTQFTYVGFKEAGLHTVQAVYIGDEDDDIAISNIVTVIATSDGTGQLTGDYKLTFVNPPSSVKYMDNYEWKFRLTRGGSPVANKMVEIIQPNSAEPATVETDTNGIASLKNDDPSYVVGTYDLGARFYDNSGTEERLYQDWKKCMKIVKNKAVITTVLAETKGNLFKAKLTDPRGNVMSNKKLLVYINDKKNLKTTNQYGYVFNEMGVRGHYNYKVVYAGDSNIEATTVTAEETINA